MAIKGVEFALTGDPGRAKSTVVQALQSRQFRLTWSDEWTGSAERGNKVANAFAGALAQYFKVGLQIMAGAEGQAIVRLQRQSSGWMGGAIRASRTTKNLERLRDELASTFGTAGVLVGMREL